jgi:hypothetical protein
LNKDGIDEPMWTLDELDGLVAPTLLSDG